MLIQHEVRDIVQEAGSKTTPKKKKCKKAKWISEEALQIAVKRREVKSKGEKERYTHLNGEFQRIARRERKAFFSDQCKEIEENNRMGKTRDLFKKIRDIKGTFHAKMGSIKDRNGTDLTETSTYTCIMYAATVLLSRFSHVRLCATPEMAAHQALPSLGFSRQEHWSGLPFPSPIHEVKRESKVAQSCPTLSNPMNCSLPGSSVHGIFQARVLEWVAIAFSCIMYNIAIFTMFKI